MKELTCLFVNLLTFRAIDRASRHGVCALIATAGTCDVLGFLWHGPHFSTLSATCKFLNLLQDMPGLGGCFGRTENIWDDESEVLA